MRPNVLAMQFFKRPFSLLFQSAVRYPLMKVDNSKIRVSFNKLRPHAPSFTTANCPHFHVHLSAVATTLHHARRNADDGDDVLSDPIWNLEIRQ